MMNKGGILYKDFWDFKQPAIFYFYLLGGKLFSFSEEGIHSFEILYWFCFSLVIIIYFRKRNFLNNSTLYILFPLFTVGSYYILANATDLTQVEILVSMPLAFCIFIMDYYSKTNKILPYFFLGVLFSLVLFYKLIFLLIIGGLVVFNIMEIIKIPDLKLKYIFLRKILPALAGFSILPGLFFIYIFKNDILEKVISVFFVLPPKIITELPVVKSFSVFVINGFGFVKESLPLFILAIPGLFLHSANQRPLVIKLLIWIVLGTIVIYLQKYSYWHYHYQLLIFPLGILSLIGIDKLITKLSNSKIIITYFIMIVLLPFGWKTLKEAYSFYIYNPLNSEKRLEYKNHLEPAYLIIKDDAKFLENIDNQKKIYVCGTPLYYYFSNRYQPVSTFGYCLEFYFEEQFEDLVRQLNTVLPEYIFISKEYFDLLNERGIVFQKFLESNYSKFKENELGLWLKKNV